jgi:undecaprenyl diphosphate synthase
MSEGEVTPNSISAHLYCPEMPNVDLLIRTSGETRISNFMLWQIPEATVYFTDHAWPDFNADELDKAISSYQRDKQR